MLNRRAATSESKVARDALATGLPLFTTEFGLRVAFSEALTAGLGVTAYAGGDVAAVELRRLADEVEDVAATGGEGVANAS